MNVSPDTTTDITPRPQTTRTAAEPMPDGTKPIPLGSGIITSLISKGGTAQVYEIWNNQLEVSRAVKLLNPDYDESSLERFETEIKITAKLHHPNIVDIYYVGNWKGLPYLEMEHIDGSTLEGMLENRGALPVDVCTAIGIMASRALHHAHNHKYMLYGKEYHGIIHRDIKPANIMVAKDGTVKLMDFGIAKPVAASHRTMEGMVVGTMQYLAPEQLQGFNIDTRADIYAFGAVLYELLTGCKTFPEENLAKLVTLKLDNNFKPIENYRLNAPPKLKALVSKCLLYQKKDRIQSTLVLVKNLEAIHAALTKSSPEETIRVFLTGAAGKMNVVGMRNRIGAVIAGIAVVVLCAGGGGALFYFLDSNAQMKSLLMKTPAPAPVATFAAPDPVPAQPEENTDSSPTTPDPVEPAPPSNNSVAGPAPSGDPEINRQPREPLRMKSAPRTGTVAMADQVARTFATADMLGALDDEMRKGQFRSALEIIGKLPPDVSASPKVQITRMRALQGTDSRGELAQFLTSQNIEDGEFYVAKAGHYCRVKDLAQAREYLSRAMMTPGVFIGQTALNQSRAYAKALLASASYEAAPTPANLKDAVEAWMMLKEKAGDSQNRYFREAEEEIARLGKTADSGG